MIYLLQRTVANVTTYVTNINFALNIRFFSNTSSSTAFQAALRVGKAHKPWSNKASHNGEAAAPHYEAEPHSCEE